MLHTYKYCFVEYIGRCPNETEIVKIILYIIDTVYSLINVIMSCITQIFTDEVNLII